MTGETKNRLPGLTPFRFPPSLAFLTIVTFSIQPIREEAVKRNWCGSVSAPNEFGILASASGSW